MASRSFPYLNVWRDMILLKRVYSFYAGGHFCKKCINSSMGVMRKTISMSWLIAEYELQAGWQPNQPGAVARRQLSPADNG